MRRLAHGLVARIYAGFDKVVEALEALDHVSGIYLKVFPTRPRIAVAVGEKYFLRAGNSLAATTIAQEESEGTTLLRIVTTGARRGLFDLTDMGATADYAAMIAEDVADYCGAGHEVLNIVDFMERGRSGSLDPENLEPRL